MSASSGRITLTDVLIGQLVSKTYPLRLVLHGLPIHDGMLELLDDRLVNCIALSRSALMASM